MEGIKHVSLLRETEVHICNNVSDKCLGLFFFFFLPPKPLLQRHLFENEAIFSRQTLLSELLDKTLPLPNLIEAARCFPSSCLVKTSFRSTRFPAGPFRTHKTDMQVYR